ncbi:MAG: PAS domain S-box protein, partial [Phycisphaerae bacterium]|nr:PAS domain S-box protein [Phycisphaerae bacterium]
MATATSAAADTARDITTFNPPPSSRAHARSRTAHATPAQSSTEPRPVERSVLSMSASWIARSAACTAYSVLVREDGRVGVRIDTAGIVRALLRRRRLLARKPSSDRVDRNCMCDSGRHFREWLRDPPPRVARLAARRAMLDAARVAAFAAVIVIVSAVALWRAFTDARVDTTHGTAPASAETRSWPLLLLGVLPAGLMVIAAGLASYTLRRRELLANASARDGRRRAVRAARRYAESERRFRMLADCAPLLIWSCDSRGRVDFVSRPWSELVGRSEEMDHGEGWIEALHPEDRDRCRSDLRTALREHRAFSSEYRIRRTTGEVRNLLHNAVPRRNDTGAYSGLIGAAMDVT